MAGAGAATSAAVRTHRGRQAAIHGTRGDRPVQPIFVRSARGPVGTGGPDGRLGYVSDRPPVPIRDPRALRALAHPARLAILDALASGRTGTATQFAEVVGLSPSATSYHLRALARYGLVEEAPSRGDGRERVWRHRPGEVLFDADPDDPPELWEAGRMFIDAILARDDAQARRWAATVAQDDPEWSHAAAITKTNIVVTAEELEKINQAVLDLLRPYQVARRADPPVDARPVLVNYRAFPTDRLPPPDTAPGTTPHAAVDTALGDGPPPPDGDHAGYRGQP
jgi:DNA-binding transcriptional ArsR family regulator